MVNLFQGLTPNIIQQAFMNQQLFFIAILTLLFSCNTHHEKFDSEKWYQRTKDFILTESNLPTDSTSIENYANGKTHKVIAFNNGHPTIEKWFRESGEQISETHYSCDGEFELRREICVDGQIAFEGIFYKKSAYGLSTWWGCGKIKEQEGIRFNEKKIGIWKSWDENGIVKETDYKNNDLIDSLETIKFGSR